MKTKYWIAAFWKNDNWFTCQRDYHISDLENLRDLGCEKVKIGINDGQLTTYDEYNLNTLIQSVKTAGMSCVANHPKSGAMDYSEFIEWLKDTKYVAFCFQFDHYAPIAEVPEDLDYEDGLFFNYLNINDKKATIHFDKNISVEILDTPRLTLLVKGAVIIEEDDFEEKCDLKINPLRYAY